MASRGDITTFGDPDGGISAPTGIIVAPDGDVHPRVPTHSPELCPASRTHYRFGVADRSRWSATLVGVAVAILTAGCSSAGDVSAATCFGAGSGEVTVCTDGGRSAPWLNVTGLQPGSTFTWTIDGSSNSQTISDDGTLPGKLAIFSTAGGSVVVAVDGTKADGTPYSETVTVG